MMLWMFNRAMTVKFVFVLALLLSQVVGYSWVGRQHEDDINIGSIRVDDSLKDSLVNLNSMAEINHSHSDLELKYKRPSSSTPIEVEEARIFEKAFTRGTQALKYAISYFPDVFKTTTGTLAGIVSLSVKFVGSVFNIFGDVFLDASNRCYYPHSDFSFIRYLSFTLSSIVNSVSISCHGIGRIFVLSGEIIESATVAIGQAIEDSFVGLNHVLSGLLDLVLFSLQREDVNNSYDINNNQSSNDSISDSFSKLNKRLELTLRKRIRGSEYIFPLATNENLALMLNGTSIKSTLPSQTAPRNSEPAASLFVWNNLGIKHFFNSIPKVKEKILTPLRVITIEEDNHTSIEQSNAYSNSENMNISSNVSSLLLNQTDGELPNTPPTAVPFKTVLSSMKSQNETSNTTSYEDKSNSSVTKMSRVDGNRVRQLAAPQKTSTNRKTKQGRDVPHRQNEEDKRSFFQRTIELMFLSALNVLQYRVKHNQYNSDLSVLKVDVNVEMLPTLRPHAFVIIILTFITVYIFTQSIAKTEPKCIESEKVLPLDSLEEYDLVNFRPSFSDIDIKHEMSEAVSQAEAKENFGNQNFSNGTNKENKLGWKIMMVVAALASSWLYLGFIEQIIRDRTVSESYTKAIYYNSRGNSEQASPNDIFSNPRTDDSMETAEFVNNIIKSLWSLSHTDPDRPDFIREGLGPYLSETFQILFDRQLALVPPGVASIKLKQFEIGTQPPVALRARAVQRLCKKPCLKYNTIDIDLDTSWICPDGIDSAQFTRVSAQEVFSQGLSNAMDMNKKYLIRQNQNSYANAFAACEQAVLDVDFAFVSKDMVLIFTLNSMPDDMKSVLPEGAITISDLSMRGRIRIHADLIPEFPFIGNATFSFVDMPVWDMTVSSFGGIDLSFIPGVYHWINVTVTWLFEQISYPKYTPLDLKHTICPRCAQQSVPPTGAEVFTELAKTVTSAILSTAKDTYRRAAPQVKKSYNLIASKVKNGLGRIRDAVGEPWIEYLGADGDSPETLIDLAGV